MKNPWKQYSKLNPQRENGNRQIASDVFHALIRAELSGAEFRVVMAVIDKTWGFSKESDSIAISQLMELTGLAERTLKESIKTLKEKRVLVYAPSNIRVHHGSPLNEYLFNKHYDTWHTIRVQKRACMQKNVNKGAENCKTRVQDCSPTKETITKETITKERNESLPLLDNEVKPPEKPPIQQKQTKSIKQKPVFVLPDWINTETWEAYREMRQRKKAPMTDRAKVLVVKVLEKLRHQGQSPEEVLNQSIMKSWTGVFPLREEGGNGNGRSQTYRRDIRGHEVPDESERINAEYLAAKAAKKAASGKADGISKDDDAPDFPSI